MNNHPLYDSAVRFNTMYGRPVWHRHTDINVRITKVTMDVWFTVELNNIVRHTYNEALEGHDVLVVDEGIDKVVVALDWLVDVSIYCGTYLCAIGGAQALHDHSFIDHETSATEVLFEREFEKFVEGTTIGMVNHLRMIQDLIATQGLGCCNIGDETGVLECKYSDQLRHEIVLTLLSLISYCVSRVHSLDISYKDILEIIDKSNQTKLGADGKPIIVDGKVQKGPNFIAPEAMIKEYLEKNLLPLAVRYDDYDND